jgi:hypothetical protein
MTTTTHRKKRWLTAFLGACFSRRSLPWSHPWRLPRQWRQPAAVTGGSTSDPERGVRAPSGRAGPTDTDFGRALVGSAPVGRGPSELAVNPRTHTIYVTNGNAVDGPNLSG